MSSHNTTSEPSLPIAVIICSGRQPRVGDQITSFVIRTIQSKYPTSSLTLIDLLSWNLPMFNEPTIPSQIRSSSDYIQPHTRAWSEEISKYKGYVFVTPQYNWGYPAILKNAIDYLFNEWKGKAAMVVSYGGHGGGKAAVQLKGVLEGCRMGVVERMPGLHFPDKRVLGIAAVGGELFLEGDGAIWGEMEREEIGKAYGELLSLLGEEKKKLGRLNVA
ncbi:putative NADPH-dependent FMN reductase [Hyaloscypha finlandica]|nr:putative NADPH-dependent FMN reductase [Hyaloscypha finlandica]